MKQIVISALALYLVVMQSCSTSGIFGSRSPHEQYSDKLKQAGLHQSQLGNLWLQQADLALGTPLAITLPYRENGYFAADAPRSAGLRFRAKQGQRVVIGVSVKPVNGALLFIELWRNNGNANKPRFVAAADSSFAIVYEADENNELILRLQPELLATISYSLTITAEPSLAFPVPGNDGRKVSSFWGDARDGGKRKHEGVDIFGKFRAPLIAAEDGTITRTGENNLGGKVIWLSPQGKDYTLYYAHLDEQLAGSMQRVKKGDTIGLMGNSGNAKNTPTHLHFGIYTNKGAVDPLPFIQQVSKEPEAVKGTLLNALVRTAKNTNLQYSPEKKSLNIRGLGPGTLLQVHAATGNYYKVSLMDGVTGYVELGYVGELGKPLQSITLAGTTSLYAQPDSSGATIAELPAATPVKVFAYAADYVYVQAAEQNGWIKNVIVR